MVLAVWLVLPLVVFLAVALEGGLLRRGLIYRSRGAGPIPYLERPAMV